MTAGLLLLTGGRGRRLGGPKHLRPHPAGGSWGGHLAGVFAAVFPGGPVQVLGEALPDRPDLVPLSDPLQGPAAALGHWAGLERAHPLRWWVAACDQVRWTPEALDAWHRLAAAADPRAEHWVLARHEGRIQPLGGFLADSLVERLRGTSSGSLLSLVEALPSLILDAQGDPWLDVDTPEALEAFRKNRPGQGTLGSSTSEVP
jgi:molybdopterin-guanine dinucleotide biosynthesis protein A